jgi:regulator of protease activity HflC (stomatin/prohibitin superfamily)
MDPSFINVLGALAGVGVPFLMIAALIHVILVKERETVLVEQCGKRHPPIKTPGFHILPFWGTVVFRNERKKKLLDTRPIPCRTKDGLAITIDTFVYYTIDDPAAAFYNVDDFKQALVLNVESHLSNAVSTLASDEINNGALERALQELRKKNTFGDYGIVLDETRIENFALPERVSAATQEQVTQRHRALVEQQRVEAELAVERQKLAARGEKEKLEHDLETKRRQARITHERLEQERVGLENAAVGKQLIHLKENGVLDAYVALEKVYGKVRIFQSEYAPTVWFGGHSSSPGGIVPVVKAPIPPPRRSTRPRRNSSAAGIAASSEVDAEESSSSDDFSLGY